MSCDVHALLVASELICGVRQHELAQSQRADFFHLADGARSLRRRVAGEALKQLAHYFPFGVQQRADDKREAEAFLVFGVEAAHARHLRGLQESETGRALLLL